MLSPDFRCPLQIHDPQSRIGGRLEVQELSIRSYRAFVLLVLCRVHKRGLNSELGKPLPQELGRSAINVALGNNVITTLQQSQKGSGNGVHPRGEKQSPVSFFQVSNRLFSDSMGGISVARIEHVGRGRPQLLLVVRHLEGRRLINGRRQRSILLGEIGAAADRLSFGTILILAHGVLPSESYSTVYCAQQHPFTSWQLTPAIISCLWILD